MAVYESRAGEWRDRRRPERLAEATRFADLVAERVGSRPGDARPAPVVDLGCGPGWCAPAMGEPVVALDAARAMLDLVAREAPGAMRVQADLARLPFARSSLVGAWASRSYVHLPRSAVPLALADLHRSLRVGSPVNLRVFAGDLEHGTFPDDTFPGRRFSAWPVDRLLDVVAGAGFTVDEVDHRAGEAGSDRLAVWATRERTLPDTVGAGMRLLVCGLNPSVYSADAGIGFARPGNRFWPAALAAGLVSRGRDPHHALVAHGVGMTDLVKRATPRADGLGDDEYRAGLDRVTRLVGWLRPRAVCFVGLAGWRSAIDRRAAPGEQPGTVAGVPVYVMPSTSGLNARSSVDALAEHLASAAALADR